jgi:UDP-N-acetylmuramoylalanine--D-glutamate ligase
MKIGVLGNGITATAVRDFLSLPNDMVEVPIEDAEIIVTSPGIPPRNWPKTTSEIISDIEFAYRILKQRKKQPFIIGVTGTNGKTTVTAGIAHALNQTPYGNIGMPLIANLDHAQNEAYIILELSSFQLFSSPSLYCDVAIIMNIESDHLDWHESMDRYVKAKKNIIQSSNQTVYLPQRLADQFQITSARVIEALPVPGWPRFLGQHNKTNAAIIYDVLAHLGIMQASIHQAMSSFELPPFRCEPIYSDHGVTIINDSKATNMAATMAAVNSFSGDKLLILCGEPKEPYPEDWINGIFNKCHTVYAAGFLSQNKQVFPESAIKKILFFDCLKVATQSAIKAMSCGIILFSPSGASFDEFQNYIDRGQAFNRYVKDVI